MKPKIYQTCLGELDNCIHNVMKKSTNETDKTIFDSVSHNAILTFLLLLNPLVALLLLRDSFRAPQNVRLDFHQFEDEEY